jgi:hypothetical protein
MSQVLDIKKQLLITFFKKFTHVFHRNQTKSILFNKTQSFPKNRYLYMKNNIIDLYGKNIVEKNHIAQTPLF